MDKRKWTIITINKTGNLCNIEARSRNFVAMGKQ